MVNQEQNHVTNKKWKFPWGILVIIILAIVIPVLLIAVGEMYLSFGIILVLFAVIMFVYQYLKKIKLSRNKNIIIIASLVLGIILIIFNYNNRVDTLNGIEYKLVNVSGDNKEFTYKFNVPNDSDLIGKLYRVDFQVKHTTTDICRDMQDTDHKWLFKINSGNASIQKEFTPERNSKLSSIFTFLTWGWSYNDPCDEAIGNYARRLDYDFKAVPGEYKFSIISPIELTPNDEIFITLNKYLSR